MKELSARLSQRPLNTCEKNLRFWARIEGRSSNSAVKRSPFLGQNRRWAETEDQLPWEPFSAVVRGASPQSHTVLCPPLSGMVRGRVRLPQPLSGPLRIEYLTLPPELCYHKHLGGHGIDRCGSPKIVHPPRLFCRSSCSAATAGRHGAVGPVHCFPRFLDSCVIAGGPDLSPSR